MVLLWLGLGSFLTAGAAESKPIAVMVGQEFKISLQCNPTTGYQWQFAKPPDEKFVRLLGSEYNRPDTKLVGAGGHEVWTFNAVAEGKTKLKLNYVRPWEQGIKPARSTNFVVAIQQPRVKAKAQDSTGP